jgi:hypothetical protein
MQERKFKKDLNKEQIEYYDSIYDYFSRNGKKIARTFFDMPESDQIKFGPAFEAVAANHGYWLGSSTAFCARNDISDQEIAAQNFKDLLMSKHITDVGKILIVKHVLRGVYKLPNYKFYLNDEKNIDFFIRKVPNFFLKKAVREKDIEILKKIREVSPKMLVIPSILNEIRRSGDIRFIEKYFSLAPKILLPFAARIIEEHKNNLSSEFCLLICNYNTKLLKLLPKEKMNEEHYLAAIKTSGKSILEVPEEYLNSDLIVQAGVKTPSILKSLPQETQTSAIQLKIALKNKKAMKYFKREES